jgi:hypothetical protein
MGILSLSLSLSLSLCPKAKVYLIETYVYVGQGERGGLIKIWVFMCRMIRCTGRIGKTSSGAEPSSGISPNSRSKPGSGTQGHFTVYREVRLFRMRDDLHRPLSKQVGWREGNPSRFISTR